MRGNRVRLRVAAVVVLAVIAVLAANTAAAAAARTYGPAPGAFRAQAGNGWVLLSWATPKGSAGIEVIRNGVVVASKVKGNAWWTSNVRNGYVYTYNVRSLDKRKRRSKTSPTMWVQPLAPPPAPTGVVVRNQDGQVTVTWNRPNSWLAATNRAYVNGVARTWAYSSAGVAVVRGLPNDTSYLLSLYAANNNNDLSNPVNLTITPTAEVQRSPFGLTPVAGDGRVDLTWLPVAGAERYELYRNFQLVQTLGGGVTSLADVGLTNNQVYRYQIRVVVSGQTSAMSPLKSATPLAVPAAPGPVTARPRDGTALLSWPAPVDPVAVYELRRDGVKVADVPGDAVTYTDSGLINGRSYRYTLTGQNANQAIGPASAAVTVVPAPAPDAPAPPTATPGDNQITVSWPPSPTISRWVLLRDGVRLATVDGATSFVDTSAANRATYTYRLVAVAADEQESAPSAPVSATPNIVPPAAPAGLRADAGDSEVTVTWAPAVPPPAHYLVYRDGALVSQTTGSSVRDVALDNGTTYRYTVTAVDARGIESPESGAVAATPASAGPDAPTLTTAARHEEVLLHFATTSTRAVSRWRVLRDGFEVADTADAATADRSLSDGRVYRYQVQALYADGGVSPLSAVSAAVPRAPWRAVAVGGEFACGVHVDGGVRCWGANDSRQLGDGSAVAGATGPVRVPGPTGVTALAAGPRHACAAAADGRLWCWGAAPGAPPSGGPGAGGLAAPVAGLTGVTAVDADDTVTCAVASGSVWCFGESYFGVLGDVSASAAPVRIDLPATAVDVTVGGRHACARLADATVACWGANEAGQSGGTPMLWVEPTRVAGFTQVSAVSAGTDHTCLIAGSGGVVTCFGAGEAGQLGRAGAPVSGGPEAVDVPPAAAVSAGDRYTCVTLLSGQARCFGAGAAGQLGDGAGVDRAAPVAVLNLDSASAVVAGSGATTCVLTRDGSVWCFGANRSGQVGTGDAGRLSQPGRAVVALAGATQLGIGADAGCMLRDASVWCWGANRSGAAGQPAGVPVPTPTKVALPAGVTPRSVAVGPATVCATTTANELYCWGANDAGQAGQAPASVAVGVSKVALTSVSDAAVGGQSACARRTDNTLWCFGRADRLGAGLPDADPHPVPVQVVSAETGTPLTAIGLVAVGSGHTCAVGKYSAATPGSGAVWCFGDNSEGQLGAVGAAASGLAEPVAGLVSVTGIAAGRAHTCAVSQAPAQTLYCFGANAAGQLGLGDTVSREEPVAVASTSSSRVAAGGDVTCVKSPNAQGWCFGAGTSGQTGNGLLRASETRPQILYSAGGGILPTVSLTTNGTTTCSALSNGSVVCWGVRALSSFGEGPAYGYPTRPVVD